MIVNHSNIEKWIFDYFEGNLSLHEQIELREFIRQNPVYALEIEAWEKTQLEEDDEVPVYAFSDSLMVAETTLLQRTWKYAAGVVLLLTGAYFSFFHSPSEFDQPQLALHNDARPSLDSVSEYRDAIPSQHLSTNQHAYINLTANVVSPHSYVLTPHISYNETQDRSTSVVPDGTVSEDHFAVVPLASLKPAALKVDAAHPDFLSEAVLMENGSLAEHVSSQRKVNRVPFFERIDRLFDKAVGIINLKDPTFINNTHDPMGVNPAVAGLTHSPRLDLGYRDNWHATDNNSKQIKATYRQKAEKLHGGVAVSAGYDRFENGMYQDVEVGVAYAPTLKIDRNTHLSAGVELSMSQKQVNFKHYRFNSRIERERGVVNQTYDAGYEVRADKILYKDLSVGALLNTSHFYLGASIDHVLEPSVNLYSETEDASTTQQRKYSVQLGTDYKKMTNAHLVVSPQMIFTQQGQRSEFWLGSAVRYKHLMGGISASNQKSVRGTLGIQDHTFRLSYSYDLTKSQITDQMHGSHEATVSIFLKNKQKGDQLTFN